MITRFLARHLTAIDRKPDFVIGDPAAPYMLRWWLIPRNPVFNIYLHRMLRSDDDRALHDHPWVSLSLCLMGRLIEHDLKGQRLIEAGQWRWRGAGYAHRLEIIDLPVDAEGGAWTLFVTGPRIREWGFLCPKGWRHWREFCAPSAKGQVGRGCGE